jgi:hypothetical protein
MAVSRAGLALILVVRSAAATNNLNSHPHLLLSSFPLRQIGIRIAKSLGKGVYLKGRCALLPRADISKLVRKHILSGLASTGAGRMVPCFVQRFASTNSQPTAQSIVELRIS